MRVNEDWFTLPGRFTFTHFHWLCYRRLKSGQRNYLKVKVLTKRKIGLFMPKIIEKSSELGNHERALLQTWKSWTIIPVWTWSIESWFQLSVRCKSPSKHEQQSCLICSIKNPDQSKLQHKIERDEERRLFSEDKKLCWAWLGRF